MRETHGDVRDIHVKEMAQVSVDAVSRLENKILARLLLFQGLPRESRLAQRIKAGHFEEVRELAPKQMGSNLPHAIGQQYA